LKSILITGCSSGIGYASAIALKARGWRVFATARNDADIARLNADGFEALYLDYTDRASIASCAAEVGRRAGGGLDALFNNGTYGQPGAVEDLPTEALEAQFQSGFFGWHELTRLCLPLMRANGGGRIVQCSSVLGLVAMKWRGAYNAMKFAVEALSDTMRLELKPHNIQVILIEPGPIATRFVEHALDAFEKNIDRENSFYKTDYIKQSARLGKGGSNRFKLPAEAVAAKLVAALESRKPKNRYYVTTPTYMMALCKRFLPPALLDRVVAKASDQ
jgi:NAD(P)-dependent dehydrogenase (short-subunit alcohol dehydrogenase family)